MRLGNVTFMAIAMGLIWGGIWMVLTSLMMMLVTGHLLVANVNGLETGSLRMGNGLNLLPIVRKTQQKVVQALYCLAEAL